MNAAIGTRGADAIRMLAVDAVQQADEAAWTAAMARDAGDLAAHFDMTAERAAKVARASMARHARSTSGRARS